MTWLALHAIAARRGDGLHPALVHLLERRPADPANGRQDRRDPPPVSPDDVAPLAGDVMRLAGRRR